MPEVNVKPSREDLEMMSDFLESSSPTDILNWAIQTYKEKLTFATAFGLEGCALIAMLSEIPNGSLVRVFNLETGYQFKETLELRETIREKYGISVEYVRPTETVQEMEARFGGPIYGTNPDECCRIRKVLPLSKALNGYEAWISAIRRDQTPNRALSKIVEWDEKHQMVKISPLANWTKSEVGAYVIVNEVPYNPLHDRGYPSIGCWPCTRSVSPDEDERAGRWSSFIKTECGIHQKSTV